MSLTVESAIITGANLLASSSDSAKLDAQVLLLNILQKPRSYLFTWPEKQLTDEQAQAFEHACERRLNGEPVSHITGYREFWSLQLEVNSTTLIPRPDTETLVELALACDVPNGAKVLDLGTGTGAIALALGSEMPAWDITGVDLIDDAVALAKRNQERLAINNVSVEQSDWFSALKNKKFDLIVTNPPYIEYDDKHLQQGDVRFEPLSALVAGDSGLADIKQIITQSRDYLHSNGYLLIEHGFDQSAAVRHMFTEMAFINVSTVKDLGNNDRVTFGQWP